MERTANFQKATRQDIVMDISTGNMFNCTGKHWCPNCMLNYDCDALKNKFVFKCLAPFIRAHHPSCPNTKENENPTTR